MTNAALLTKREVARLLGCSERHVERRQNELGVVYAGGRGKNGRRVPLFPITKLPAAAQRKQLPAPEAAKLPVPAPVMTGQLELQLTPISNADMSAPSRELADRRYAIIAPLADPDRHREVWRHCGGNTERVVAFLAEQHQAGKRSIYRWLERYRDAGYPALADRARKDKGHTRALTPAALGFLWSALKRDGAADISVAEIWRVYEETRAWRKRHPEAGPQLPETSYSTIRAWWKRNVPEMVRVMAFEGAAEFANTQEILSHRDIPRIQPLEYVVMDHRMLDIHCLAREPRENGWRLVRPWVTAAIDMRTRRWLGWAIVEQPSSDSIACVLKRAMLDHGIPGACYWDNGKDFRALWLEGGRTVAGATRRVETMPAGWDGVLNSLGVRVVHAIPLRARSKIIEPNFLRLAYFDRTLPWWCGHRPDARPEAFDALVAEHERWKKQEADATPFATIEQIAAIYDAAFRELNGRPLEGLGMEKATPSGRGWLSPDECWSRLIGGVTVRRADPQTIQFAFLKRREITVEHGEVTATIGGRKLHYRLAGQPVALMWLNGRKVELAYDPLDLETAALYLESQLIGLVENVELRGMGEQDFVADEKNRQRARRWVREFIAKIGELEGGESMPPKRRQRAPVEVVPEMARLEPGVPRAAEPTEDEFEFFGRGA